MPAKFENAKYVPVLSFILQDQISSRLDINWFPWLKDPPADDRSSYSSRGDSSGVVPVAAPPQRKKPSWATRKGAPISESSNSAAAAQVQKVDLRQNGARVIFFMIGGVTNSEIRAFTETQSSVHREVLIGSTHIWSPDGAVEALKEMGKQNVKGAKYYGFKRPMDHRIPVAPPENRQAPRRSSPPTNGRGNSDRNQEMDRRIPPRPEYADRNRGSPTPPPPDRRGMYQPDLPARRNERSNSGGPNGAPNPSLMQRDGHSRGPSHGHDRSRRARPDLPQDMSRMAIVSRGEERDSRDPRRGWLRKDDQPSSSDSAPKEKKGWFGF